MAAASTTSSYLPDAAEKVTSPYGSWKSPITADVVCSSGKELGGMAVAGDGRLVWIETRHDQGGRAVLVKESAKMEEKPMDIIPPEFASRTLAQYGGGAFAVLDDTIIFSNYKDQRLYKLTIGSSTPIPITPDYRGTLVCYADGSYDPHFNRYLTVMEDHRKGSLNKPIIIIASIDLNAISTNEPKELVVGNDFYAFPRVDPNGKRMAWIEWSHPNMPWDKAELWVGYFSENGDLSNRICVAGGDPTIVESPTEPKWSPKGELFFITDRGSGFWNLYKWDEKKNEVVAIYSLDAEFTKPLWVFGISSYDFVWKDGDSSQIICTYRQNGRSFLGILDYGTNWFSLLDIHLIDIGNLVSCGSCLYVEGASTTHPLSIFKVNLDVNQSNATKSSILWSSSPDATKYDSYFSFPEVIEFPTEHPGQNAYAFFYPPSSPTYKASVDEKPPLLLESHVGPTGEASCGLNLKIQYWTSRGWAFVDVNYGGSTGYGREYRERILGQWGIVDVNDCCSCAKFLVESGKVDGERLCVTGRSASGYTTLASLAFKETFKAGASLYGVADLSLFTVEAIKFESHYFDNLVGDEKAYLERSPINHVDKFSCPVILFQGLDDKVVPPVHARMIHKALKDKGLPVALVEYEGEQHWSRKPENIKFTLEQQMVFFARLVGHFEVADPIIPIKIDNFD
ncbi:probable dipeptidyl-peptidase 5 isoform X2 [Zingiber officinale]|uniref:probable dipeptidyl-peptidase 5 isoform X2 n=1 Tax=Zingiber officinale TaxID=94328 RepID=UPI001C4C34F5|nr:probable dipeptidyl-peptidase 5 isoform X2 [Zingiber officinale]